MDSRTRILNTLNFDSVDRVAHFESMFELEKEAFGLSFPKQEDWANFSAVERERALDQTMEVYSHIIDHYQWDALAVYNPWEDVEAVALAVKNFGRQIFVGGMVGHSTHSIESVTDWEEFAYQIFDDRPALHAQAELMCQKAFLLIRSYAEAGADFVYVPNDIAFNAGPFVSPEVLDELVFPYLKQQVDYAKSLGLKVFLHTDGEITSILERFISMEAHCLQSIDPMAGVDIKEVKAKTHGKLALMGNVQCSLLQDGPLEAIEQSAKYSLESASPGGGYIFSSSNTIFDGLPLSNYEYMVSLLRQFNQNYQFGAYDAKEQKGEKS